ncbi:MAG: hypothetical protein J0I12_17210 [Candidatus Eremiobacteraeota bacterium]|nr:hypothetical protein [Candidatus Eremiobacteraeota bacterium]
MKLTRLFPLMLLPVLVGPVQSAPDDRRLYLVVGQVGKCTRASEPGKAIGLLSYLGAGDIVTCPPNGSLTVTSVVDGSRYQIFGTTPLGKTLTANDKTIKALNKPVQQRKGIEVSHAVDMSKYGGYTSRSLSVNADAPIPVSVEKLPITLDLTLTQHKVEDGPSPMIRYRKVNERGYPEYTTGLVSSDGTRLTLRDLKIDPEQTTMIYFGNPPDDKEHDVRDNQAVFAVTLIDPKVAQSLQTVGAAGDPVSTLEAFENYCNLEVYWPARKLRDQLLKQHPEARTEIDQLFKKWIEPSA